MIKSNKTFLAIALSALTSFSTIVKADGNEESNSSSSCVGFRTYTIGGWGANCNGNNAGCYRDAHFSQAFPNGLTIGSGNRTLKLTTAQDVNNFLPSGGTASILPYGLTLNPGGTYNNVLAAQLVAVTLAVGFDAADPNFGSNNMSFGNLKIKHGPFAGLTVIQFLSLANDVISGTVTPSNSLSEFNSAATSINESYENGVANYSESSDDSESDGNGQFLSCNLVPPLMASIVDPSTIDCFGNYVAELTVSVTGGVAPYTYLWSNGATTATVNNLPAGTYSVTVTDASGNATSNSVATVTLPQPDPIVITMNAGIILCNGQSTNLNISAIGGVGNYTGTGDFTVGAGTYTYSVVDGNGCEASQSITINEPSTLVASSNASAILCNGGSSTVVVSATGGVADYSGTGSYTVSAGDYSYTVTDANGCTASTSVSISEPTALVASSNASAILCNGGSSTVVVSATGGVADYSGTGSYTVSAGDYSYTVTDANGCTASTSVSITEPSILTISANATNVTCNGASNGSIVFAANGGTTSYTFTPTKSLSSLSPGSYSALVTDANGCTASTSVVITQPNALAISISKTNAICYGGKGTATVSVIGGTPAYSYAWDGGSAIPSSLANLTVGNHSVVITDANGCAISGSASIQLNTCTGFTTVTQGGWGASCSGGNWGTYLSSKFASAFPTGVIIGVGSRTMKFTTVTAIKNFLPSSGTPAALPNGCTTNPCSYKNTLAGQALALSLNIRFDNTYSTFSISTSSLSGLVLVSGPCAGMTVAQALTEANKILGGQSSLYSASTMTSVLDVINKNYDNGTTNLGALACACPSNVRLADETAEEEATTSVSTFEDVNTFVKSYPNPFSSNSTIEFNLGYETTALVEVYSMNGQRVAQLFNSKVDANQNFKINFDASNIESGIYFVKLVTNEKTYNHKMVLTK